MKIAIDDTYGPVTGTSSALVTTARRTHVAVVFSDEEAKIASEIILRLLTHASKRLHSTIRELHFADIYNKSGAWKNCPGKYNLAIMKYLMITYSKYKWRVLLQTIDERTMRDHPQLVSFPSIEGLNPQERSELSLILLLLKIRIELANTMPQIEMYVDGGLKKVGNPIGKQIFSGWQNSATGHFTDSAKQPLLQIADFLAFTINRITHLSLKSERSILDFRFLQAVSKMQLNCEDLTIFEAKRDFTRADFDEAHLSDRRLKGLDD